MHNNHKTFYDIQVAHIADFLGKSDLARETLEGAKEEVRKQINPDGEMPLETARNEVPYDYELYNLYAFSQLAQLGQKYSIDLWKYHTEDGRSIRKAIDYFVDFLKKGGEKPIKMDRAGEFYLTFRSYSKAYGDRTYWDLPKNYFPERFVDEATAEMFK